VLADAGVASEVIKPKLLAAAVLTPGLPGRKLLVTLNASKRISILCRSWIWNCLEIAWSHSQNDGPNTTYSPRLPKVPNAGAAKAAGFSHCSQKAMVVLHDARCEVE